MYIERKVWHYNLDSTCFPEIRIRPLLIRIRPLLIRIRPLLIRIWPLLIRILNPGVNTELWILRFLQSRDLKLKQLKKNYLIQFKMQKIILKKIGKKNGQCIRLSLFWPKIFWSWCSVTNSVSDAESNQFYFRFWIFMPLVFQTLTSKCF